MSKNKDTTFLFNLIGDKEKLKLLSISVILVLIYAIGRIMSILTHSGTYNFIENTISSSGYIFVENVLNFPSVTWFGISLYSLSFLGLIFLYLLISNHESIKKEYFIVIFKILTLIQISCLLLLPVFPSDVLFLGHMILTITLFISVVISSLVFMLCFKRKSTILIFILVLISFIILGIVYLQFQSVLGLFEKVYSYIAIALFLNSIYLLSSFKD
jgi:hypothetical protein